MAMAVSYINFCGRVVAENRGGVKRSYVRDTVGNTIGLLDENQNFTDTLDYWPYGEIAARTGTNPTSLLYGGTQGSYNGILSQIYNKNRFLDTHIGNWTMVDAIWPRQRPYAYAHDLPTQFSDPTGMCPPGTRKLLSNPLLLPLF